MSRKYTYSKYLLSFIFSAISIYSYGQSILGDDYKKELWKTIKPSEKSPLRLSPSEKSVEKESFLENKYMKAYNNSRYGKNLDHLMEIAEPKYKISPALTEYKGSVPLNVPQPGSTTWVYMGGHFYLVSVAGIPVFPSGISLFGGDKKKLSAKSKSILVNVFGMEVEE